MEVLLGHGVCHIIAESSVHIPLDEVDAIVKDVYKRQEPVWRGVGGLHGRERCEEMGTAGKLRPQVCGEYRPGYRPRYSLLCHADLKKLLHCRP